jgi:transcriptional regulator with XRE-family HTH domain
MTPEQALGKAVQRLRLERGLSQEQLAFESGLHRTYISLLERGLRSPKFGTIVRLAAVLAIRPSELVASAEAHLPPIMPGSGGR